MDYVGRFQQGQEVPLWLLTSNASRVPTNPDAAPLARVYGPSGFVAQQSVPVLEPAALTGAFQGFIYLGENYPAGTYTVRYQWTVGAYTGGATQTFEVLPGGDPTGQVLAMTYYPRPHADFVFQQRSAGRVFKGKKPRVP